MLDRGRKLADNCTGLQGSLKCPATGGDTWLRLGSIISIITSVIYLSARSVNPARARAL